MNKTNLLNSIKKFIYYLPAIITTLLTLILLGLGARATNVFIIIAFVAVPWLAGLLLSLNKAWGALFGISFGLYWIYTSTLPGKHVFNEGNIGIFLVVYYLVCMVFVYSDKLKPKGKGSGVHVDNNDSEWHF